MFISNSSLMTRALSNINRLSADLARSNYRLTTGRRINSAADDPSGLIAALNLESQIARIDGQVRNGNRISSIIGVADGALGEMSTLMTTIQTAVTAVAGGGLTAAEIAAYQATVDTAIDGIDRIVSTTNYNGTRLLDGGTNYTTSTTDSDKIGDIRVHSATTAGGATVTATITVVTAPQQAQLSYDGGVLSAATFDLTGPDGTASITINDGDGKTELDAAINAATGTTGISASYAGGGAPVYITTDDYGAAASIAITFTSGTAFSLEEGTTTATGADAVLAVNGSNVTSSGDNVYKFSTSTISGEFALTAAYVTLLEGGSTTGASITASGSGAGWSLDSTAGGAINFGQASLATTTLGHATLGYLSSLKSGGTNDMDSGNLTTADSIVDEAINTVSFARARTGGISSYTIGSTLNYYASAQTSLAANLSQIRDLDYAFEIANNNRLQILMDISIEVISTLNKNAANILSLLA